MHTTSADHQLTQNNHELDCRLFFSIEQTQGYSYIILHNENIRVVLTVQTSIRQEVEPLSYRWQDMNTHTKQTSGWWSYLEERKEKRQSIKCIIFKIINSVIVYCIQL